MNAYFSCGAGDFIAIESFLTDHEKKSISGFYLITRAARTIQKLISMHPIWKGKNIYIPYTEERIFDFGVYSFYDIKHLRKITKRTWYELEGCVDFSGEVLYTQILSGKRNYNKSEFEVNPAKCDIVIDPESEADDRLVKKGRNLSPSEITEFLIKNQGRDVIQVGHGYTTVDQALSLIKGCNEFIGVDSMCAAWACRQPDIKKITVKTVNKIYKKWLPIYDPFNRVQLIDRIN